MSVDRKYYTIIGCDLSQYRDEIRTEEFCESDLYEKLTYNQREGEIQFFDDPMSGEYLYFGYILGEHDEYDDSAVTMVPLDQDYLYGIFADINKCIKDNNLSDKILVDDSTDFQLISFCECS